jgi:copper(I)-binding protein
MKNGFLALLAALLAVQAAGCSENGDGGTSQVAATVRLPLVPGRPSVGYLMLPVVGDRGALVSVTSPRIGRIEMHESMTSGGMSSMRPLQRIPVEDGEIVAFAPNGRHLMLFDMDPRLRAGERIDLTFNFDVGGPQHVEATVVTGDARGH